MSHINRRGFLKGTAALFGSGFLSPISPVLPAPLLVVPALDPYSAFAEALVAPILAEIKEASIMRKIFVTTRI